MALPPLQRMHAFCVAPNVDSRTRQEAFIDSSLQNELAEIRLLFSKTFAKGVLDAVTDVKNRKKLCFGCELVDVPFNMAVHNHRCKLKNSMLFMAASKTVWGMLNEEELKAEWFKAMETSRKATKQGILRFFQVHFDGCKVEYMKRARQTEIALLLDRAEFE